MPFGKKPVSHPAEKIDFNEVFDHLLRPALEIAGCIVSRADTETAAGDIRTDMFYALATADIVVADVSAPNTNVFYELGIRDAMRSTGVLLVRGDWEWVPPFDIVPDRFFGYQGKFFTR